MWTRFMDMHSGGSLKEKSQYIYIEAPVEEAKVIFYNRFGHNPDRVTCTCCGEDYTYDDYETLRDATAWERRYYDKRGTLSSWLDSGTAITIYADEIEDHERVGDLPEEGWVWVG